MSSDGARPRIPIVVGTAAQCKDVLDVLGVADGRASSSPWFRLAAVRYGAVVCLPDIGGCVGRVKLARRVAQLGLVPVFCARVEHFA